MSESKATTMKTRASLQCQPQQQQPQYQCLLICQMRKLWGYLFGFTNIQGFCASMEISITDMSDISVGASWGDSKSGGSFLVSLLLVGSILGVLLGWTSVVSLTWPHAHVGNLSKCEPRPRSVLKHWWHVLSGCVKTTTLKGGLGGAFLFLEGAW